MKRFYPIILISFLFFFTKGYTQYTAIPDSDFEYALYIDGIDDVMDGRILNTAAESTTVVQVDLEFITDLTGIEAFTNLELLNISNNAIETIDLSQNTALKELYANYNDLVALDLSNNPNLEYLSAEFNDIQTIDLSQCYALEYVNLNNAGAGDIDDSLTMPAIDITNSSNLTYLDIGGLGLAFPEIDLSQNTALEHLDMSGNRFTSIDVTHNTQLIHFEFGINPNITNIDLSQNIALEWLDVYNPPITELDLSYNINLKTLFLDGTDITELDLSQNVALEYAWIWFVPYLEELDFSNCVSLTDVNADSLDSLTYVNLKNGNNEMIDEVWVTLREDFECIEVDDPITANLAQAPYDSWNLAHVPSVIFSDDCREQLAEEDYLLEEGIQFFPNPVVDNLHINNTTNQEIKTLFIYDHLGKLVLQSNNVSTTLPVPHLQAGMYYIKIIMDNNKVIRKQIIKK